MHVTQDLNSFGEIIAHVQLMKKMSDARKNIFCVYHIRIIAPKKNGSRHETDRFLNNHCQECVRAYLSIHDCLSFRHEVMTRRAIIRTKQLKVNQSPQQWRGR
jgi:hypothetical protein